MILNPKHIAVLLVLTLILTNLLISYAKPDILFIELAAGTGVLIVFFGYIPYLFVVKNSWKHTIAGSELRMVSKMPSVD